MATIFAKEGGGGGWDVYGNGEVSSPREVGAVDNS